jgi:hypothetical protein
MATKKKLLQAAAGQAGGAALNVEDVFSTYLYEGNASGQGATAQSITNNIDLSGEGGLVWIKNRNSGGTSAWSHYLFDTERGATKYIRTNLNNAEGASNNSLSAFNSDGFTLGETNGTNNNGDSYASWTFRKAPKFFDVVTYTGDGTTNRKISHNLGSVPGFYLVKQLNDGRGWAGYHRGANGGTNPEQYVVSISDEGAEADATYWNDTAPTATEFTINNQTPINENGGSYVAYLWAHNDGDGEFGPDGDADIIKCGSYTGTGATPGPDINLGFEPQWILLTNVSSAYDGWTLFDNMRGLTAPVDDDQKRRLVPHSSEAEASKTGFGVTPTGFGILGGNAGLWNASGNTYIYVAIRKGPMAIPENATDVFDVNLTTSNQTVTTGFPVDLQMSQYTGGGNTYVVDRMRGMATPSSTMQKYLMTQSKNEQAEDTTGGIGFNNFTMTGFNHTLGSNEQANWSWRRAPHFFDIVHYKGDGQNNRQISHNLGVAPEMIIVKAFKTSGSIVSWYVYHSGMDATAPEDFYMRLDQSDARTDEVLAWNDTAPTASNFTVSSLYNNINGSGRHYIAYLYATLDGISKVGSYTGNGSATGPTVDCGFSSGPRYVMIKEATGVGNWFVMDGAMGIVAGNDPRLILNSSTSKQSSDYIDPTSTGFQISTSSANINSNGETYIFYAIA